MIEYNIVQEHGKKVYVLKRRTAFRVVQDLLETDYLGTIIDEVLEEDGEVNESLTKGALVSDRRALKKKLARENIMVNLVMNRFLENEIPLEQFLFVQQFVGSYIFKSEGADALHLRIKRGINEEYFRKKGIKLANLNKGEKWRLESIQDIVAGKCTLGHDIRYAFTAVNNFGERLVFGSTCVHDFFDIDEQLTDKLTGYVEKIKDITDEYYNDYHAFYEVHKRLDMFMAILVKFVNKLTDGKLFTNQELGYVDKFIGYGLPVPRALARIVGIKIQTYLNHSFNRLYYPENFKSVGNLVYMLYCFSLGAHGYTKQDLRGFFPTNFLGDRIMPEEAEQLDSLLTTVYASMGNSDFVNEMALKLSEEQFMNILNNLYQVKQLTQALETDNTLALVGSKVGQLDIVYRGTDIQLSSEPELIEKMFGFSTGSGALNLLVNSKLNLRLNKRVLNTVDAYFINSISVKGEQSFATSDDRLVKDVLNFTAKIKDRMKSASIFYSIIRTGYLDSKDEASKEWLYRVFADLGVLDDFKKYKQSLEGTKLDSVKEYEDLLKEVEKYPELVYEHRMRNEIDVLKTIIKTKQLFVQQNKYIDVLKNTLKKVKSETETDKDEGKNEFEVLLEKAKANADLVSKHKLDFAMKVLDTVSKTGRASEKQMVYIDKLKSMLLDV